MKFIVKFKKHFLIGGMLVLFLTFSLFIYLNNREKTVKNVTKANELVSKNEEVEVKEKEKEKEKKQEEEIKTFYVDIKGQVNNPGVYLVNETNIVNDVITFAGGLNSYADTKCINLSKKVTEEMVIYVYSKSETRQLSNNSNTSSQICNTITNNAYQNPTEQKQTSNTKSTTENNTNTTSSIVNINTADANTLSTLSGIGESKANDIINYRNQNGPFKSIEDIKNVSGIGESTFKKIKDKITV